MTFPVVIEGTGEIYGEIRLLGFGDETERTLADARFRSETIALDSRDIEYFAFVMRQLREFLGAGFLRWEKHLRVAVTDGGYLSYSDARRRRIAVPYQLLQEGALPFSEASRRLVIEDVMANAVYTLHGDRFCRGLQRYVNRFGAPLWPLWYSRQQLVTTMMGLHRYLHLDLEKQILLRDAYEQVELGDGSTQPYSRMLRELQGSNDEELPTIYVARCMALVAMNPELFPQFVDRPVLAEVQERFLGANGVFQADEEAVWKWMIEENRQTRDVSEVLWPEHIETAIKMERCLRGISLKHNRPSDVLRRISDQAPISALKDLYIAGETAKVLDDFCKPVNELCQELQARLAFGLENIRTYVHLVLNFVAEKQGIGRYPGDRVEFLEKFAVRLKAADCHQAENAARAYADAIDEEMRFLARQRAAEDRAEAAARERSMEARERLEEKLAGCSQTVSELSSVLRQNLVLDQDFVVDDVRGAINDILRRFYDQDELSTQLMQQLERQAKDAKASQAFREAVSKRYSLSHDRQISYSGLSSTEIFEIFTSLLIFEENVPELEDAEGKLDLRREAETALNKEKGILRKLLLDKKVGWIESITTGEIAQKIGEEMQQHRLRVEDGDAKSRANMSDAHFRLGVWSAVHGEVDDALTHMREVVRLTLDDELIEAADNGHFPRRLDAAEWKKKNKYFRQRADEIRRAKAAGNYLELFARRAERDLETGRRPEIEPDLLEKILDTLETERVLGDRAPTHKILRYLPRIETIAKEEYRIRDFLPAGAGGQAGQMALLRHVFSDEPFSHFMGYKVVEVEREKGRIGRYMTKVGINDYVRREYMKVFPRLFPNFEGEMIRQRNGLPNQVFACRFVREFHQWLERNSKDDLEHIQTFEADVVEVAVKDRAFPLLQLEFVPGLSDDLPKTVYAHQADADGNLGRKGGSVVKMEKAMAAIREDITTRRVRETGLDQERLNKAFTDRLLDRLRAHTACLATLFMNVDHQIFMVDGKMIAMDYEILFAPCFDPEWDSPLEPGEPVSTYFTKRINVSWVGERDDPDPYYEVAGLYAKFVLDQQYDLMDWAMEAGFLLTEAGAVRDVLVRNAGRLPEDVGTLVQCGGTVFLTANRRDPDGTVEFGHVVPRKEMRRGISGGLADLLAGRKKQALEKEEPVAGPARPVSEMTATLKAMHQTLSAAKLLDIIPDDDDGSTQAVGARAVGARAAAAADDDATMNLGAGRLDTSKAAPLTSGAHAQLDDEATMNLGGGGADEEATMNLGGGGLAGGADDEVTMNLGGGGADEEATMNLGGGGLAGGADGERTMNLGGGGADEEATMNLGAGGAASPLSPGLAGDDEERTLDLRPPPAEDDERTLDLGTSAQERLRRLAEEVDDDDEKTLNLDGS